MFVSSSCMRSAHSLALKFGNGHFLALKFLRFFTVFFFISLPKVSKSLSILFLVLSGAGGSNDFPGLGGSGIDLSPMFSSRRGDVVELEALNFELSPKFSSVNDTELGGSNIELSTKLFSSSDIELDALNIELSPKSESSKR